MQLRIQHRFVLILLTIFYFIGLIGISHSETQFFFTKLTPLNMLFTLSAVLYGAYGLGKKEWGFLTGIFLLGYGIELLGVHTQKVFGAYHYGNSLGWTFLGVPPLIGINWLILVISTSRIAVYILPNKSLLSSFWAAISMVFLDLLIEPLAPILDFWYWDLSIGVPIQNFMAWLAFSWVLNYMAVLIFKEKFPFILCLGVYLLQIVFFACLNCWYL